MKAEEDALHSEMARLSFLLFEIGIFGYCWIVEEKCIYIPYSLDHMMPHFHCIRMPLRR